MILGHWYLNVIQLPIRLLRTCNIIMDIFMYPRNLELLWSSDFRGRGYLWNYAIIRKFFMDV
ncbi:MAG: hypothetical protein CM1200mP10_29640 [Candidatus Neomarinimicrobiota bacterium]|nr:MAG: hypothetical protein CM1200mP10_29640 [Candidatus Neomarinimicrobiota bacterium]